MARRRIAYAQRVARGHQAPGRQSSRPSARVLLPVQLDSPREQTRKHQQNALDINNNEFTLMLNEFNLFNEQEMSELLLAAELQQPSKESQDESINSTLCLKSIVDWLEAPLDAPPLVNSSHESIEDFDLLDPPNFFEQPTHAVAPTPKAPKCERIQERKLRSPS